MRLIQRTSISSRSIFLEVSSAYLYIGVVLIDFLLILFGLIDFLFLFFTNIACLQHLVAFGKSGLSLECLTKEFQIRYVINLHLAHTQTSIFMGMQSRIYDNFSN